MRIREFRAEQRLARPPAELFNFFGEASNLDALTPAWLRFEILTPTPMEIREGSLIDYKLWIRGVPIRWRTRIKIWEPPHRFVDEQLRGPYRLWVHEHTFEPNQGGTLAKDYVRYAVPFDWLTHAWLARPDIERIFRFRAEQLAQRFGGRP